MPGLTSDIVVQCRTVLLQCREFQSYEVLRAVFVTEQLSPFRSGLPRADSPEGLVDRLLDHLIGKRLSGGYPVLPIFLATLRDRVRSSEEEVPGVETELDVAVGQQAVDVVRPLDGHAPMLVKRGCQAFRVCDVDDLLEIAQEDGPLFLGHLDAVVIAVEV